VFLTHGHYDHIGGVTQNRTACFPNAAHFMSQVELDKFTSAPSADANFVNLMLSYGNDKLNPMKDQFQIVGDGDEIVPGINFAAVPSDENGGTYDENGNYVFDLDTDEDGNLTINFGEDDVVTLVDVVRPINGANNVEGTGRADRIDKTYTDIGGGRTYVEDKGRIARDV
jgi:metal-dependent hydrolase (beta-lactamase superfamily II)